MDRNAALNIAHYAVREARANLFNKDAALRMAEDKARDAAQRVQEAEEHLARLEAMATL